MIIEIITLILAIPFALILEKLCKEELKDWKSRFKILSIISLLLAIASYFSSLEYKTSIITALLFITITFAILVKRTK